jgi:hypothetical protein
MKKINKLELIKNLLLTKKDLKNYINAKRRQLLILDKKIDKLLGGK